MTRLCPICQQTLPLAFFRKPGASAGRLRQTCNACYDEGQFTYSNG